MGTSIGLSLSQKCNAANDMEPFIKIIYAAFLIWLFSFFIVFLGSHLKVLIDKYRL